MRISAAPTCPAHYLLDTALDDCEYDYPGGVGCPGCLQFNFALMECDNYLALEGENYDSAGSSYKVGTITAPCVSRSSVSSVYDTGYGHTVGAGGLDYNTPCLAGALALEFFDSGGSSVPQFIIVSGVTHSNPQAVWAVQRGWQWNCCLNRYTPNFSTPQSGLAGEPILHWTVSPAGAGMLSMPMIGASGGYGINNTGVAVYNGCVDGLVEDSGAKSGSYGTSHHPFDAGTVTRPLHNFPKFSSGADSHETIIDAATFTGGTPYQLPTGLFGALQWHQDLLISGTARPSGGCYSPFQSGCPDPTWGSGPPCAAPSEPLACPAGYSYNPVTNLCEISLPFISFDRGLALGNLCVAEADPTDQPGSLRVLRYDDSLPEVISETVVVETDGCLDCCISTRRTGEWILTYIQLTGGVYNALVRRSFDQGRTWQAPMTIATGYQQISHYLDERGGILAVLVYNSSAHTWGIIVGTIGSDGLTWSFTSPVTIATGAAFSGQIRRRKDGVWEFVYVTTLGSVNIVRCKSLSKTGAGVFA